MDVSATNMLTNYYMSGLYQQNNLASLYSGLGFGNILSAMGWNYSSYANGIGSGKTVIVIPEGLEDKLELDDNTYCIRLDENGNVVNTTKESETTTSSETKNSISTTQSLTTHSHRLGSCSMRHRMQLQG